MLLRDKHRHPISAAGGSEPDLKWERGSVTAVRLLAERSVYGRPSAKYRPRWPFPHTTDCHDVIPPGARRADFPDFQPSISGNPGPG